MKSNNCFVSFFIVLIYSIANDITFQRNKCFGKMSSNMYDIRLVLNERHLEKEKQNIALFNTSAALMSLA